MADGFLIDADIFRLYVTGHPITVERILTHVDSIALSSVTVEEMVVGRFNMINRARSDKAPIALSEAYEEFAELLEDVMAFPVQPFSAEAEKVYRGFPASIYRIGPQDCRLAAQAMAHNLIVVTRNLRDLQAIGATSEDWSA